MRIEPKNLLSQVPLGIALAVYFARQRRAAMIRAEYEKHLDNVCQEITGYEPVPDEFVDWVNKRKDLFE